MGWLMRLAETLEHEDADRLRQQWRHMKDIAATTGDLQQQTAHVADFVDDADAWVEELRTQWRWRQAEAGVACWYLADGQRVRRLPTHV